MPELSLGTCLAPTDGASCAVLKTLSSRPQRDTTLRFWYTHKNWHEAQIKGFVRFFNQVQSRLLLSCPPKLKLRKNQSERERESNYKKCMYCTSRATPKPVFALFQEQTISLARSPKWLDWHGLWLSSAPISRFCGRSSARQVHSVADTVIWSLLIGLPNRCYKTQRQATLWSCQSSNCWQMLTRPGGAARHPHRTRQSSTSQGFGNSMAQTWYHRTRCVSWSFAWLRDRGVGPPECREWQGAGQARSG